MKRGFLQFTVPTLLVAILALSLSGCGSGGTDSPFVFPETSKSDNPCKSHTECSDGKVCSNGTCVEPSGSLPPPIDCSVAGCPAGQTCNEKKVCENPKPTCSTVVCSATQTCNPSSLKCECDPAKDPNKCLPVIPDCTNGLTCPADQQCNMQTKQCEPKPPVTCNPVCSSDQVCNNGKCEAKPPVICDPACAADQVCNNGKCEAKPPVICDPACTADQVCNNGKCEAKPPVTCDPLCIAGQVCNNGKCEPVPVDCTKDGCLAGQVCDANSKQCVTPDCTKDDCPQGKICNVTSKLCELKPITCVDLTCSPSETCNATTVKCECDPAKDANKCQLQGCALNFVPYLTLRGDASLNDKQDIPSTCDKYFSDGQGLSPQYAYDLRCCEPKDKVKFPFDMDKDSTILDVTGLNKLICSKGEDPTVTEEGRLSATLWKPYFAEKTAMPLSVKLTKDPQSGVVTDCQISFKAAEFPFWKLENTAIQASLLISSGAAADKLPLVLNYADHRLNLDKKYDTLNPEVILAKCAVSQDAQGNVQLSVGEKADPGLQMRFFASLYKSQAACNFEKLSDPQKTCLQPFSELFQIANASKGEIDNSNMQIIPGFDPALSPLNLITGLATVKNVGVPNVAATMAVLGSPLHFDTAKGKSSMRLVTALHLPNDSATSRCEDVFDFLSDEDKKLCDIKGVGQIQAQLQAALLTAALDGEVTLPNGQPVKTLSDLENCGNGEPPPPPAKKELKLEIKSTFADASETVVNTEVDPKTAFSGEVCLLGLHGGGKCNFSPAQIPYFKSVNEPYGNEASLQDRFTKSGKLILTNQGEDPLPLSFAKSVGAFQLDCPPLVAAQGNFNFDLAAGTSLSCSVLFTPAAGLAGCQEAAGNETTSLCASSLALTAADATLPVKVNLVAAGKKARGVLSVVRIDNEGKVTALPLQDNIPVVDFGEKTVGFETQSFAFDFSNTGVRDLTITPNVLDTSRNFRASRLYQGANLFEAKLLTGGKKSALVKPMIGTDLFQFTSYGPFGGVDKNDQGESKRDDFANLNISSNEGVGIVSLKGTAKNETRAVVGLYIQDEKRFTALKISDLTVTESGKDLHLYRAEALTNLADPSGISFSLRQDTSGRAVYLVNDGVADELKINSISYDTPDGVAFELNKQDDSLVKDCAAPATKPCVTLAVKKQARLGTVALTGGAVAQYKLQQLVLKLDAYSKSEGTKPLVAKRVSGKTELVEGTIPGGYRILGTVGAPNGIQDFIVHRLMALLSETLSNELNITVSSLTQGIATRANVSAADFVDRFVIPGKTGESGIELDPESGTAMLYPVFTPVGGNDQLNAKGVQGIRLFNAPGAKGTVKNRQVQYLFECAQANPGNGSDNCGFFFIYIGGWDSTQNKQCGLPPVYDGYTGKPTGSKVVLDPSPKGGGDAECMRKALTPVKGEYDPVSGKLTFRNLAVRLFSYKTPLLNGNNIDVTMHMTLTTDVVDATNVSDPNATGTALQPKAQNQIKKELSNPPVLDYLANNENPLLSFIDPVSGFLHGRSMVQDPIESIVDEPDFFKDVKDHETADPLTFELAGLSRMKADSDKVGDKKLMYLVITVGVQPPTK